MIYVFHFVEEAAHQGCGLTLHAISQQSPDTLRRHATLAMPLAFLAMHEKKDGKVFLGALRSQYLSFSLISVHVHVYAKASKSIILEHQWIRYILTLKLRLARTKFSDV